MPDGLLPKAADWFKARGATVSFYSDDDGPYAFRTTVNDQELIVAAKKELYQGRASFMERKVVDRAVDRDALLCLFVATGNYQYVFDADAVKQYGDPSDPSTSKRAERGEPWLEIPVEMGVAFNDWASGYKQPKRHPDPGDPIDRESDPSAAESDDDTPDRPWDITDWSD